MRIGGLSASSGRFFARITASVTTVDRYPDPRTILNTANTVFASIFAVPAEGGNVSAETLAAATAVAQHDFLWMSSLQGGNSSGIPDPAASFPSPPGNPAPLTVFPPSGRISTRTHRRTTARTGTAPPAVDYGFGPGGAPRPSSRCAIIPPRAPRRRSPPTVVAAYARIFLLVDGYEHLHPVVAKHCLKRQSRKSLGLSVRWPIISIPLPDGLGIAVRVDYSGPLRVTPRGNTYILPFTDRFSRRAGMFTVIATEFTV